MQLPAVTGLTTNRSVHRASSQRRGWHDRHESEIRDVLNPDASDGERPSTTNDDGDEGVQE